MRGRDVQRRILKFVLAGLGIDFMFLLFGYDPVAEFAGKDHSRIVADGLLIAVVIIALHIGKSRRV